MRTTLREGVGGSSERELKGGSVCELEAPRVICSRAEISPLAAALKAESEFSFGEAETLERTCSLREGETEDTSTPLELKIC